MNDNTNGAKPVSFDQKATFIGLVMALPANDGGEATELGKTTEIEQMVASVWSKLEAQVGRKVPRSEVETWLSAAQRGRLWANAADLS